MKVYDFCEPWLDGSVILRNLIDQSLLLCALFWRPWDVPCADIVPTRYTSAKQTTKNKTRCNFLKNRNRATIFAIKCAPTTFFVKLTVQSAYKVPPGEPLGAFKISIRFTGTTRTFKNTKLYFLFEKLKNKRSPAGRRIAGAPRKAIWAPKMSNCERETSNTQKLKKTRFFRKARKSQIWKRLVARRGPPWGGPFQDLDKANVLFTPPKRALRSDNLCDASSR